MSAVVDHDWSCYDVTNTIRFNDDDYSCASLVHKYPGTCLFNEQFSTKMCCQSCAEIKGQLRHSYVWDMVPQMLLWQFVCTLKLRWFSLCCVIVCFRERSVGK